MKDTMNRRDFIRNSVVTGGVLLAHAALPANARNLTYDMYVPTRVMFGAGMLDKLNDFLEAVKTGEPLDTEEIHQFMDRMSGEARRITFRLNSAYRTPGEVRAVLSELFGYKVPDTFRVFPPFYTDFGKNIHVGEGVFINACCHFQDHGGVTLGDGCQIGHNVVFATLNHFIEAEKRKMTYSAPIVLGKNVWVGSNATILQGVTIGDNAVVGAGAVVTKDVPANTVVGGVPAKFIKSII